MSTKQFRISHHSRFWKHCFWLPCLTVTNIIKYLIHSIKVWFTEFLRFPRVLQMHILVHRCLFLASDLIFDRSAGISSQRLLKTKPIVGYFCFWNLLVCNFAFQRKIIHAQVRVRFIGRLWQSIHFTQKVACVTSTWQLTRKKNNSWQLNLSCEVPVLFWRWTKALFRLLTEGRFFWDACKPF